MKLFSKSKSKNDYAKVIDWNPKWDISAPTPQVFSKGRKTFLIYLVHEDDPSWEGAFNKKNELTGNSSLPLALVEFDNSTVKFGVANDEVFTGLSLWEKGLEAYKAHVVENSSWIDELKTIHKVYPYYHEKRWKDLNHYLLLFKDDIFECISTGYTIETFNTTFKDLVGEVAIRMNN